MTELRDLLELVRAPAALSVPGDVVSGAAAGQVLDRRTLGLACSSVCLYWAGMAANDWADRRLDAVERPERPIPSGRVSPAVAFTTAAGLTAVGLAAAGFAGGRRAVAVATPLAAAVWSYDLAAKNTPAGPLAMALCRGLDVLLGASPGPRMFHAAPTALGIATHTYLLTVLSRGEVSGTGRRRPATTLAGTIALAATACGQARGGPRVVTVQAALAGLYAVQFGSAQARAVATPSAHRVRGAVTAGIVSLPALQGALAAREGAVRAGLTLALAVPIARHLVRKLSAT